MLLIEDDRFLAHIYGAKLESHGFEVFVSHDGEKGLKEARREKPSVIILDILLPKMDGFTVLHELKKDKQTAHIPVILLTNLGQKHDVERGLALGASEYFIKAHTTPDDVVKKIKEILTAEL